MTKSNPFSLKSYRVESESMEDLSSSIQKIKDDGFDYVIAPVTKEGAKNIIDLDPNLNIYFPTINKNDVNTTSPYFVFGGIDYNAQSKLLLKEAVSPLIIFSDRSQTGKKLATYQEKEFLHPTKTVTEQVQEEGIFSSFFNSSSANDETKNQETTDNEDANTTEKKVIKYFISRRTTNLERYLKDNENIINGSFFLNTPIIKSGMVMSQLTLYDTNASNILSTQINYDPLLLSMTQYIDRKKMIVANSIIKNDSVLIETNSLLGNDIVYDWINYTTTIGVDYFYNQITGDDRDYDINISNNQMVYGIELLHPGISRFLPYVSSHEE
jgi:SRSO17 transposase